MPVLRSMLAVVSSSVVVVDIVSCCEPSFGQCEPIVRPVVPVMTSML